MDDRKLVFKHYCLTWGPIDVLSTVPFDLIGEAFLDDNALFLRTFRLFRVLRMVRLLKLARLLKMRKTLAALEGIWTVHTGVFRLFRLIAEVMFIAHLLACMWHFIPLLEAPPTSGRRSAQRHDLAAKETVRCDAMVHRVVALAHVVVLPF